MIFLKSLSAAFAKLIAVPLVGLMVWAGYQAPVKTPVPAPTVQTFGGFNPTGGGTYRLQSSIGTTNTSIPLSSFKEPISGTPYTMSYLNTDVAYGTLDPQQPTLSEFVSFTGITQNADGTALLTGVTRGLSRSYPYTNASSTVFSLAHAGQSIFILSNSPNFQNEYLTKRNAETITGVKTFASTTPPQYDSAPNFTTYSSLAFADLAYVANATSTGGVAASETIQGTSQLATGAQASAGTSLGSTGARLVIPASLSTSTCTVAQNSNLVTQISNGKVANTCIDQTANYSWTGSTTLASTTITGPLSLTGTTTVTGPLSGIYDYQTFTSSGTWTKPTGLTGTEMVKVQIWGAGGGGGAAGGTSQGAGGGGGGYSEATFRASDLGSTVTVTIAGTTSAATLGGNSTFGTLLTGYGGGGGVSNTANAAGGGGGGIFSAGSSGVTTTAGAGGNPLGGATTGVSSTFGGGAGGGGGTGQAGGFSVYGGSGGCSAGAGGTNPNNGSYYGGGGGCGGNGNTNTNAGGTSVIGGAGGAGGNSSVPNGVIGSIPAGGGGGGGGTTGTGGTGGRGEARIWVIK